MIHSSSTIFIYSIVFLYFCGCANLSRNYSENDAFTIEGTIKFLPVEGGCWQFISTDDETYELVGENIETLYFDGIQARLVVRDLEGRVSICMVGKIIEVLKIVNLSKP
ncbi:MAG: hypothetical protein QME52_08075 [Bacteroidota bacterium]|nr:hypothetical protein [Bacteroidota bacterium]